MKLNLFNFGSGCLMYVVSMLGGFDIALKTLLIVFALDYLTGVLKGWHTKQLSSSIGVKGIIKKVVYLLIIVLVHQIALMMGDTNGSMRNIVIFFFVSNEGISILENAKAMEIKLPNVLFKLLDALKEGSE
jgi:toxin secretion/phage lysis holin